MIIIIVAIFFTLIIIMRSYIHIDNNEVTGANVIKALVPALIAITCLTLRESYFALPDEGMVGVEYLNYRKMLLWGFLLLMGYMVRAAIFGSVYIYRKRN